MEYAFNLMVNCNVDWKRPKFEQTVKTADSLFHGYFI